MKLGTLHDARPQGPASHHHVIIFFCLRALALFPSPHHGLRLHSVKVREERGKGGEHGNWGGPPTRALKL